MVLCQVAIKKLQIGIKMRNIWLLPDIMVIRWSFLNRTAFEEATMTTHGKLLLYLLAPTIAAMAAFAGDGRVQSADAKWKTIKTAHYKIHYPANPKGDFEPFAKEVASKIEGVHATVAKHVGFEAKGPINVVIRDPLMAANGMVMPNLKKPVMILWKTPPEKDSAIGHYDNWVELLLTHEITHLNHLLRPKNGSKSGWFVEDFFKSPTGPISLKAPRMITEGYATLIEGRITGSGRPHSAYRAAVIRQWALQGLLPAYDVVSYGEGFRGGSMAYLVGSAYLEWLEKQYPEEPDILQKFWKQLASKKDRDYDKSFVATFGTSPAGSYSRWKAQVTHDAVAFEQSIKAKSKAKGMFRNDQLVFYLKGEITDLAISPDGTKLLARLIPDDSGKSGIRVWDLVAEPEPDKNEKKWAKLRDDPNEVEDRKPAYIEPKKIALIGARNGRLPSRAWWAGESQVGYELRVPNKEGILVPTYWAYDLKTKSERRIAKPETPRNNQYTWKEVDGAWNIVQTLPGGGQKQLTWTLSAAWQPAPAPDGKSLYYVRLTGTGCQIRKIDLVQPELDAEPEPMQMPDTIIVPNTIFSAPDAPSLLPPPSTSPIQPKNYSVWDTHSTSYSGINGISISPANDSIQTSIEGSDMLDRLHWSVSGAWGAANGPRGAGAGLMYRGWRLAPSLQAYTSLEKPSRQRFAPMEGLDRERQGGEFALTWQQKGLTPITIKPFAAFETIKDGDPNNPFPLVSEQNRTMWGAMASISARRSKRGDRGEWGIGFNASFQGAQGSTELSDPIDGEDGPGNWQIARLGLGLSFITPLGPLHISAQEGRLWGDPGIFDMFHLGGINTSLVPTSLDLNRLEQDALPGYMQVGDRMRKMRATWGGLYYEKSAVWFDDGSKPEYQSIAGLEFRLDEEIADIISPILPDATVPFFAFGVHRIIDGPIKNKTVVTFSMGVRL
jgi:hypothetical protein